MAIARVQAASNGNSSATAAAAFSSNNAGGNMLVACIASETDSATLTSLTDTRGNTWTAVSVPKTISAGSGKGTLVGIYYAKNSAAGANTVTAVLSGGPAYLHIIEYSGLDTAAPFDQHSEAAQLGGTNTPTAPGVTTTQADELLVGFIYNNRSIITPGTGYSVVNRVEINNFSDVEDRIVSSTSTYDAASTVSTGASWAAAMATFKAAAASGGSPDHLAVVAEPSDSTSGVAHASQPVVAVQDVSNAVVTSDTSTVTAALVTVSGSGTAVGDLTKAAVAGQAFFTDLGVTGTGTFKWEFTDGVLTLAQSAVFTISDRPDSPYLGLGTDGKDLGYDKSLVDPGLAVAESGDRRGVTEIRPGGANQWYNYGGADRVQLPRTLIDSDMPTWVELQAMTQHNVSGDTALLSLLGGGTLGTGGHVIVVDHTVLYTGDYRQVFPLRAGGDAIPGGTNVVIVISKAIWDSMVANGGVATVLPEKVRVTSADVSNMAHFECDTQLGMFMVNGATKGWRFVGLYFTPASSLSQWSHGVGMGDGDSAQNTAAANIPSNIGLDRCYIDGHATCSTLHGFELNCAYGYIVDCASGDNIYIRFTGESHVFCGYNGPGPFRIVNNKINGGTQAFFIGGSLSASGMPSDIEFRYNYLTRPLNLNPADPSYDQGGNYMKNIWETKASKYLIAEYNLLENVWSGAQAGAAFLTKAESYGNSATIGRTSDILIRRNVVRNAGMGFNIAGVPNVEAAAPPERVWYVDNLVRLGAPKFSAASNPFVGLGLELDCGIVHNTFIAEGTVNVALQFPNFGTDAGFLDGIVIRDNIFDDTVYKWKTDGGTGNITTDLNTLASGGYDVDENVVIGNNGTYPGTVYSPSDISVIAFEDPSTDDYSLHGTSQSGTVGAAAALVMVTQPSDGDTGVAQATQPVVKVVDASGLTVTSDTSTVTAELITVSGTGTAIGTLTEVAAAGVANFSGNGLGVTSASGGTFKWRFTDGALSSVDSAVFTIAGTPALATKLAIQTQPGGVYDGQVFLTQPVIEVQDSSSVLVSGATDSVTVAVTSGTAVLSGTTTVSAVGGVADFSDLVLTGSGDVVLTFTATGLTSVSSVTLTVTQIAPEVPGVPVGDLKSLPKTLSEIAAKVGRSLAILWYLPTEGTVILPGESIQAAVDANPAGTTFLLQAGTYTDQDVEPKEGNSFIGAGVGLTILDGSGTTEFAFRGYNGSAWADNVTIQDLTITDYAPPAQNGAIWGGDDVANATSGWTIRGVEVSYCINLGIRIGNAMQVLNSNLHHNSTINIGGIGINVLVQDTEIAYGNWLLANNPGFESGGSKFVRTEGLLVRNCFIHHNGGVGLWLDINNIDYVLEDNQVEDNVREGIEVEISYAGIIRNNQVLRNGNETDPYRTQNWLWDAGIAVHASSDVEIYGNTVEDNFNGIVAVQQNRGAAFGDPAEAYGPYLVQNLYVHDNVITQNTPQGAGLTNAAAGIVQDTGDNAVLTSLNNRYENNTYNLLPLGGGQSPGFEWLGWKNDTEWQAVGNDLTGTFNRS